VIDKYQAIYALYSTVKTIRDETAFDADGNEVDYDNAAVEAYVASKQYIDNRVSEYPSIGDQLDALFHAGVFPDDMAAQIQTVKDKYPKGDA
jgi:hypothetical protein